MATINTPPELLIAQDVNLPALENHLRNPTGSYLYLNGNKLDVKFLTPQEVLAGPVLRNAALTSTHTEEVNITKELSATCLQSQAAEIQKILMRTFTCGDFTPSHPTRNGNSTITDTDLATRTEILHKYTTSEFEVIPDASLVGHDKSEVPLAARAKMFFTNLFSPSLQEPPIPQLPEDYGSAASHNVRSSPDSAVVEEPTTESNSALPSLLEQLEANYAGFNDTLTDLRNIRADLTRAKMDLETLESNIRVFSTDIFDNQDLDTKLHESQKAMGQKILAITKLQSNLAGAEELRNDLQGSLGRQARQLSSSGEFTHNARVQTLLTKIEALSNQAFISTDSRAIQERNPLEIIRQHTNDTIEQLKPTDNTLLSIITAKEDPNKLLFSWNKETRSITVEVKTSLFFTRDKVFIPVIADGSKGIYCKTEDAAMINKLLEATAPNSIHKQGAIRDAKNNTHTLITTLARSK